MGQEIKIQPYKIQSTETMKRIMGDYFINLDEGKIPVAPGNHFLMGGIETLEGAARVFGGKSHVDHVGHHKLDTISQLGRLA